MLLHKLRLAAMSLLLLAVVAAGAASSRSMPSRDPGRASLRGELSCLYSLGRSLALPNSG